MAIGDAGIGFGHNDGYHILIDTSLSMTDYAPMNEINREHFEAWLFSQPLERVIEAGDGTRCVLCSFIKETTNFSRAFFAGWDKWEPEQNNAALDLPSWAKKLIDRNWLKLVADFDQGKYSVTIASMQRRYLELFPESVEETQQSQPQPVPATK